MSRTIALLALVCASPLVLFGQQARISFAEPVTVFGYASGVAVEWSVYEDESVDYYVILRRGGGIERAIATVDPVRTRSEATADYRYIDAAEIGPETYYRLRAVFADESYAESDWCSAHVADARRTRILSALDDETLAAFHIGIESAAQQEVTVRIKSMTGSELDSYPRTVTPGPNVLEIDYRAWPPGYYTVEVDDAEAVREWVVHVDASLGRARTRRVPTRG